MAIIRCPECGAEISDKAEFCVRCGNPICNSNIKEDTVSSAQSANTSNGGGVVGKIIVSIGSIFLLYIIISILSKGIPLLDGLLSIFGL